MDDEVSRVLDDTVKAEVAPSEHVSVEPMSPSHPQNKVDSLRPSPYLVPVVFNKPISNPCQEKEGSCSHGLYGHKLPFPIV